MGWWRPRTPPSAPTPPPAYNQTMTQPVLSPKACALIEAINMNRELGLRTETRALGNPQVRETASITSGVMEAVPGRILPVSPTPRDMPGTPSMEAAMLALSSPNLPEAPVPQPGWTISPPPHSLPPPRLLLLLQLDRAHQLPQVWLGCGNFSSRTNGSRIVLDSQSRLSSTNTL